MKRRRNSKRANETAPATLYFMKTLACLLLIVLLTGCARYKHAFTHDGTTDTTSFTAFIYTGNAGKIRSATKSATNYSRTVSVGSLEGAGDAALVNAIAAGVAAGLKSSQGVP